MQTAGNFVGIMVKLPAGMENGQHHFHSGFVFCFVHVHRDTAAVVDHGDAVILMDHHLNVGSVARQSFVDTVIHHFVNQVMKTPFPGVPDIHGRPHPDGFQPFQNGDLSGRIFSSSIFRNLALCCCISLSPQVNTVLEGTLTSALTVQMIQTSLHFQHSLKETLFQTIKTVQISPDVQQQTFFL